MKKISLFASALAIMAMTFVSCGQSSQTSDKENQEVTAAESSENCCKDACKDCTKEDCTKEKCCGKEDCTKENCEKDGCCKEACGDCEKTAECGDCENAAECNKAEGGVIDLTDDSVFRPDTKVKSLTILDFNATWCVPCKKLTPAFHKAAEAYAGKVSFYNVDIDKNPKTAEAFGVQSVPTVVFMTPDGKVDTFVGLQPFVGESGKTDADNIFSNLSKMIDKAK